MWVFTVVCGKSKSSRGKNIKAESYRPCLRGLHQLVSSLCTFLLIRSRSTAKLEKEMATHSSILAWKTPWTGSLADCSPWDGEESEVAEDTHPTIK